MRSPLLRSPGDSRRGFAQMHRPRQMHPDREGVVGRHIRLRKKLLTREGVHRGPFGKGHGLQLRRGDSHFVIMPFHRLRAATGKVKGKSREISDGFRF